MLYQVVGLSTLYQIFTNDMPTNPDTRVAFFENDTMYFAHNRNPRRTIIKLQN